MIADSKGAEMSTVLRTVRIEGTESKSNARVGAPIGAGNEADLILRTARALWRGPGQSLG